MNTLHNMQIFVRVIDTGSFTAAAASLDVGLGTASRAISELEEHLRTRLIHRSTRRISPTAEGLVYAERCRRILADVVRAEDDTACAADRPSGLLRVHSLASLGQRHVMPAIKHYRARYPEVQVELTLSQTPPSLFDGTCDASVVAWSSAADGNTTSHRLGYSHSILCASPAYIDTRGAPATLDELSSHACLTLGTSDSASSVWRLEGPDGEVVPMEVDGVVSINIAESLATAARVGMGIAAIPAYAALDQLHDGTLVRVLPHYTLDTRQVCVLYPSHRFVDARTRSWINFICAWLPPRLERDVSALNELAAGIDAQTVAA